jgi:hypothetical protein
MHTSRYLRGSLAGFAVLLLAMTGPAYAITYNFTQGGPQVGGNVAPPGYGTVEVTTVGTDLKIEIDLDPNIFVSTGNGTHPAVAFALSTGGLTLSGTPSVLSALTSPFTQTPGGPFSSSPFGGLFNYAIDCPGNGANSCSGIDEFTFYVLNGGGLSLLPTPGTIAGTSIFMAVDILNAANGQTGTVGATLAHVPGPIVGAGIPGLVAALGGMCGLNFWRRRRNNSHLPA